MHVTFRSCGFLFGILPKRSESNVKELIRVDFWPNDIFEKKEQKTIS